MSIFPPLSRPSIYRLPSLRHSKLQKATRIKGRLHGWYLLNYNTIQSISLRRRKRFTEILGRVADVFRYTVRAPVSESVHVCRRLVNPSVKFHGFNDVDNEQSVADHLETNVCRYVVFVPLSSTTRKHVTCMKQSVFPLTKSSLPIYSLRIVSDTSFVFTGLAVLL